MRLSNSQDVSLIQHVLITLVLRLIMNDGFLFRVIPDFMGKSLVIAVRSKKNVTTKIAHAHEQSEFTYGAYLVAICIHEKRVLMIGIRKRRAELEL